METADLTVCRFTFAHNAFLAVQRPLKAKSDTESMGCHLAKQHKVFSRIDDKFRSIVEGTKGFLSIKVVPDTAVCH